MIPKNTTFLVVDNNHASRENMVSMLRFMKITQVFSAGQSEDALKIIVEHSVNIVIFNLDSSEVSAVELLKTVRESDTKAGIIFVMIIEVADYKFIKQVMPAGVNILIVKPYTTGELLYRIENELSRQKQCLVEMRSPETISRSKAETWQATVLVVDDTPTNLQLLYEVLKGEFQVRTVANGKKALDICQSNYPPDLVLLDIMMPEMDGFEVARCMREHPSSNNIPVIFVTAKTDQKSRIKGLRMGAVDFVTKPVEPELLLARIRNFMRYVVLHRQLQASCDAITEMGRMRDSISLLVSQDFSKLLKGMLNAAETLVNSTGLGSVEMEQAHRIADLAQQLLVTVNTSNEYLKRALDRGTEGVGRRVSA